MLCKLVVCKDYQQVRNYLDNLSKTSNLPWGINVRYCSAKFEDNFIQCVVIKTLEDIRGTGMQFNSIEFLTSVPQDVLLYVMSRLRCIHTWP